MRISDWSSDVCSSDLEDDDLLALLLRDNLGRNGQPVGGLQLAAVTGKQHVRQRHAFACLAGHLFNYDLVSGGDAILLAACAHHCEHGYVTLNKTRVPSGAWNSPRDKHPPRGKAALLCDDLESVKQNTRPEQPPHSTRGALGTGGRGRCE